MKVRPLMIREVESTDLQFRLRGALVPPERQPMPLVRPFSSREIAKQGKVLTLKIGHKGLENLFAGKPTRT